MPWISTRPIAHRGLHRGKQVPENSLRAFEAAIAANHPIELDIQLLADGQLAVFHDKDLRRLTGQPGRIADQTLATLGQFYLYDTDQTIPSLQAVLALVRNQVPLLIEIKNEGKVGPMEAALLKTLRSYRGEFAVQSFNPLSVAWFKRQAPEIMRGQLGGNFRGNLRFWPQNFVLNYMLMNWASAPHFIAYDLNGLPNLPATLARRGFNCPLIAWSVKSTADQARAEKHADNYIFDPF